MGQLLAYLVIAVCTFAGVRGGNLQGEMPGSGDFFGASESTDSADELDSADILDFADELDSADASDSGASDSAGTSDLAGASDSAGTSDSAGASDSTGASDSAETAGSGKDVDKYVTVYNNTHVSYEDLSGNHYDAEYLVPEIQLDGEDAREINQEIQGICMNAVDESVQESKEKTSLFCMGITYDAWMNKWTDGSRNGQNLTLLVTITNDWDYTQYLVYTMDVRTGEELDNEDLANQLGMSEDALEEAVRKTISDQFYPAADYEASGGDMDFYKKQYNRTVSEDNIEESEVYLDEDGAAHVHGTTYALAGGGSYEFLYWLDYTKR